MSAAVETLNDDTELCLVVVSNADRFVVVVCFILSPLSFWLDMFCSFVLLEVIVVWAYSVITVKALFLHGVGI